MKEEFETLPVSVKKGSGTIALGDAHGSRVATRPRSLVLCGSVQQKSGHRGPRFSLPWMRLMWKLTLPGIWLILIYLVIQAESTEPSLTFTTLA